MIDASCTGQTKFNRHRRCCCLEPRCGQTQIGHDPWSLPTALDWRVAPSDQRQGSNGIASLR